MLNSFSGNDDVFFFYIVSRSQIWIIPPPNKQVLDIPLVILLRLNCTITIIMIKKNKFQWLETAKVDLLPSCPYWDSIRYLLHPRVSLKTKPPSGIYWSQGTREKEKLGKYDTIHISAQELAILLLLNFIGQSMSFEFTSCQGVGEV